MNESLVDNESLGGYLEAEPGRYHVFYLVVNGASAQSIDEASRCSTTSPTSPLSSRKTPHTREEISRATQTSTPAGPDDKFDPAASSSTARRGPQVELAKARGVYVYVSTF